MIETAYCRFELKFEFSHIQQSHNIWHFKLNLFNFYFKLLSILDTISWNLFFFFIWMRFDDLLWYLMRFFFSSHFMVLSSSSHIRFRLRMCKWSTSEACSCVNFTSNINQFVALFVVVVFCVAMYRITIHWKELQIWRNSYEIAYTKRMDRLLVVDAMTWNWKKCKK